MSLFTRSGIADRSQGPMPGPQHVPVCTQVPKSYLRASCCCLICHLKASRYIKPLFAYPGTPDRSKDPVPGPSTCAGLPTGTEITLACMLLLSLSLKTMSLH